jgi:phytoene desaturase
LEAFLTQASYKYDVGMNKFVWKPSRSITEFLSLKLLYDLGRMDVLQSFASHIRKFFKDPKLLQLMEFPILFLGATPENTPAMYSLMNYAEISMTLAEEKGVKILLNQNVTQITPPAHEGTTRITTTTDAFEADIVVAGADYHHVDTQLLGQNRNYSDSYWNKRTLAPSSLLYYLGVNKRVAKLLHHNLFFDEDFKQHAFEIYTQPQWPSKPLFYVSAPSKTDPSVAPDGCENLFILIPVAPDLTNDTEDVRERYYAMVMERLEAYVGEPIRPHVVYKRTYAHRDFMSDYNAFKGNAYGLANTLLQTAFLKPTLKSKKIKNLFYTGQLTVPGPGVPPSLISGLVVADEVAKEFT